MNSLPSNSPAMRQIHKVPQISHKKLAALIVSAGAAIVVLPAQRADALFFDIVFDPIALVENTLKVVDMGEQIEAVVQQVANELKELEHLHLSSVPNIAEIVSGVKGQLDSNLYSAARPANQLDSRYPAEMSNVTWDQYQSDQSTWIDNQRQALVENRQLQNRVYQDMDSTTQQVQSIVDGSNSASGETSAIQAHNDLLSMASGELAKLQSLKLARSRLRSEELAQQQSEASYAEAERQRVRGDWNNPAPPTQTVIDPFQN